MENEQSTYTEKGKKYISTILNPFYFTLGMILKLPSLVFWGVRVISLNDNYCCVTIPYNWRSQNPFGSIYFASLAGAGELSTGLLLDAMLKGRGRWSMLVIGFEAEFSKKANKKITFTCSNGLAVANAITNGEQGDPQIITTTSTGCLPDGTVAAKFIITWSIKKK